MAADFWQETYSQPPLARLERCDQAAVFDWIGTHLPRSGTAIDWSQVSGLHAHRSIEDDAEFLAAASEAILRRLAGGQRAQHGGDSLSPYGVWLDNSEETSEVIRELLAIPEHHYVLAQDRTWLVVARMEGDLDVLDAIET